MATISSALDMPTQTSLRTPPGQRARAGPIRATDRDWMLERVFARDRTCDGQFITGVTTTGIYCLPSCAARKPKPENIRFFAAEREARADLASPSTPSELTLTRRMLWDRPGEAHTRTTIANATGTRRAREAIGLRCG